MDPTSTGATSCGLRVAEDDLGLHRAARRGYADDPHRVGDHRHSDDATDPILHGLAFEARLGRPVASWRRTVARGGIVYRRRGLRVQVALVGGDTADRASVILVRSDGRGQPDLAELAVVRQDFFPFELVVRARWAVVASARVVVLEAIVPAAWEALRDAS